MSDSAPVRTHLDGGVSWITLNRPDRRNALSASVVAGLADALRRAELDEGCTAVVLRGAGSDFCAGADLHELAASADAPLGEQLADARRMGELFLRMRETRLPLIAAVHGRALAGGCGLATACDIVIATDSARFGYPEVGIGFVPAMVMAMLRRSVGEKRAFELVATGRVLDAGEAERIGLVNRVVPQQAFDTEIETFGAAIAARSATALGLSKRLLYAQDGMDFDAGVRTGSEVNVLARLTADARAGIAAFATKSGR